ncbi:MAG: AIR synthase family protein [Firmicutes bacterium]|nr:AIR synthase family protein [Bacillota bacterium]
MLKAGKLDSDLLKKIVFDKITFRRPEVLTRPGIGEDCAVVDFGSYDCVMSTDPITAAISDIGRLSVHISCNDIASNGIEPLGIMLAVMLPVGTTEEDIEEMMRQAGEVSARLGVEIIGGHTEITPAVNTPVIVSTAIGRAPKSGSQQADQLVPGDYIMITKSAGLEGSGIIACDFEEELKKVLTDEEIAEAKSLLDHVSVVTEGVAAGKVGTHGMHDVTEGGVLGAVWELCQIAGTGAEVWVDEIPVKDVTKKICNHFDIDYLRLISSGCMVIMVPPEKKAAMEQTMAEVGVELSCIGVITEADKGIIMKQGTEVKPVDPPASDELYKVVGR